MKLKYKFIVREVAGQSVALPVGEDSKNFNGMIKLNSVGEFIFKLLENDMTTEQIITAITEKYDVTAEDAKPSVESFLDTLKQKSLITE